MDRAQAPLTAVEAALGVLLLSSVAFVVVLGMPASPADETQLELYASDAATVLSAEGPRHADQTRLAELAASPGAFEREQGALERRLDRLLPANVLYRIETEYGTVGHPLPADVRTGTATVSTVNGDVTVRVWYA
jgi:hypothetical protein